MPRLVVLDADNTLYDWVAFFSRPLRATLFELHHATGLPVSTLASRFQSIFTERGTVEYSSYLDDGSLSKLPGMDPIVSARISMVRSERQADSLRPYLGVRVGLKRLRALGVRIVCFSDSMRTPLLRRLHAMRVLPYIHAVYCTEDRIISHVEMDSPNVGVKTLPAGLRKPNVEALQYLLDVEQCPPDGAVALGDNLMKDVSMAKLAGVYDCWARYGSDLSLADASLLVGVTNWSSSDVKKYFRPTPENTDIHPTLIVDSFTEFVDFIEWRWRTRPERVPVSVATAISYQEALDFSMEDRESIPL